jgi:hypothetical protein
MKEGKSEDCRGTPLAPRQNDAHADRPMMIGEAE